MENYAVYIIFFHILGAIVWVGGMIAVRFAVHPAMSNISDPSVRLARTLEVTGRLFVLVAPFLAIIIVTGLLMATMFGFRGQTNLSLVVHLKEVIWLIMTLNYALMVYLRFKAQNRFLVMDLKGAADTLSPIARFLLPLNIFLGVLALYFGLVLRGF